MRQMRGGGLKITMQFKYKVLVVIAPLVFFLDQLSKYFIVKLVPLGQKIDVVNGYFEIVHYKNPGAAFGLLSEASSVWRLPFFHAISIFALAVIIFYIVKAPVTERLMPVALSLVAGGILGNGLDRLRLGEVTDFLSFHVQDKVLLGLRLDWPAFNVADSAITVAMFLLLVGLFSNERT